VRLFDRLPRGIRATTAGEILLSYVRRWNRESVSLKRDLEALRGGIRGTIRIAASESFTDEMLPRAMHDMQAQFPQVDFSVISGDNYRITTQLLARDADVVLAFDIAENARAQVVASLTSPLGVITPPDHPLARQSTVTPGDCAPFPNAEGAGPLGPRYRLSHRFRGGARSRRAQACLDVAGAGRHQAGSHLHRRAARPADAELHVRLSRSPQARIRRHSRRQTSGGRVTPFSKHASGPMGGNERAGRHRPYRPGG
jgi:DNA-binding transcriptional LysR family regulator